MVKPQRIQLKRTKGFNLQAASMAANGLPAVKCARPAKYSNPFRIGEYEYDNGTFTLSRGQAKEVFRRWLRTEPEGRRLAREAKKELRGKNLACFCALDRPCHCDVLLELANNEGKVKP